MAVYYIKVYYYKIQTFYEIPVIIEKLIKSILHNYIIQLYRTKFNLNIFLPLKFTEFINMTQCKT